MNKGAIISNCGKYRYQLWRVWDKELPACMFIMLNPSTADAEKDDATIRRCIGFATSWGYGGFYVGNLFAWRDRNPEALYENWRLSKDIVGPENDRHLMDMSGKAEEVIFAWGNDGGLMGRNADLIKMFPEAKHLAITRCGHPGHPLFLHSSLKPIPFNNEQQ